MSISEQDNDRVDESVNLSEITRREFYEPVRPLWDISPDVRSAWRRVPPADMLDFCATLVDSNRYSGYVTAIYTQASNFLRHLQRILQNETPIHWAALKLDQNPIRLDPSAVDDVVYTYLLVRVLRRNTPSLNFLPVLLAPPPDAQDARTSSKPVEEKAFDLAERGNKFTTKPSSTIYKAILSYSQSYQETTYLAPYTSIVGPSGVGKSFLVKQLALQHDMYVVYISMANKFALGYPKRTPLADYIQYTSAQGEGTTREINDQACARWRKLIAICYLEVHACIQAGISPAQYYTLQTARGSRYPKDLLALMAVSEWIEEGDFDTICANVRSHIQSRTGKLRAYFANEECSDRPISQYSTQPTMVLCLDEARVLLEKDSSLYDNTDEEEISLFRAFQRAARERRGYPIGRLCCDFFAVLLDTHSKVANFSPAAIFDPSQKVLATTASKLFPPIYSLNTFDSFAQRSEVLGLNGTRTALSTMFRYGRPLWGAILESGLSLEDVVKLATQKTTICRDSTTEQSTSECLLWVSHRITLYATEYSLAEFLMAQGLRYPLYISDDRTILSTVQPSEPLLSFVSSQRMCLPLTRLRCLRALLSALHVASINVGDVGETVAALVLQLSMDHVFFASKQESYACLDSVSVESFIGSLLGNTAHEQAIKSIANRGKNTTDLQAMWSHGKVYFNHVTRTTWFSEDPLHDIEQAYRRGAALLLPKSFPGADILIPVLLCNRSFSYILVQVENRKADSLSCCQAQAQASIVDAIKYLNRTSPRHQAPCIGLFMSLQSEDDTISEFSICHEGSQGSTRTNKADDNLLVMIALGLSEKLYPSCFPADHHECHTFYNCLRQLRDAEPQTSFQDHPDPAYVDSMLRFMQV
ncbi:hypothetical protein AAP_04952 [Ascosphaera apis ARSEF 7405]|uniref:Uncharacterized protein n=1 Tax=Ascosphaera apis ARSEF 7405 TaxID=392613 RepID=A0A166N8S8_9EURO|nr:hypothetical protein AAP_04952 [Ascosphaera apis ARSEF 7405]